MGVHKKIVAVSGGFDPVHPGHIRMFEQARKLGDKLVVILNGDSWLVRKKGAFFMDAKTRKEILLSIRWVDEVYVYNSHKRDDVCEALRKIKPYAFANGGDRKDNNTPEVKFCVKNKIKMFFNVGGGKYNSSSVLLQDWCRKREKLGTLCPIPYGKQK